ncbi:MAG: SCP2 sterol-binding domain-containing protein [Sphingobium sp.]|nr:MAG: SCP2 sterol-binding domain-containing protein [Sphingobium sp.]
MTSDALAQVTAGLKDAVGEDCGLGAVVKFDFGPEGVVVIDATAVPNVVDNEDRPAQCTLKQSIADFAAMSEGTLGAAQAMMTARLKIEGDMGLAMRIDGALSRGR